MSQALALAVRVACKLWELFWRGVTRIARGDGSDPTRIFLDLRTPAQHAAEAQREKAVGGRMELRKVAVLVPFRDRWSLTESCLRALSKQNARDIQLHVLLIDNGSREPATAAGIAAFLAAKPASQSSVTFEHLRIDGDFNFSALINAAAATPAARACDALLSLNNDVELTDPDTVARLIEFAATTPGVGAVGVPLFYPDGTLQHLFLAPGVKIVAAHPLKRRHIQPEACEWLRAPRAVAAVTGAVLLVTRSAFDSVRGLDEALPTVGQDLDLCLKLQRAGLVNWVVPVSGAVHHEGASRHGHVIDRAQVALLYDRWGQFLTRNPYFSPRFSRWSEQPALVPAEPPYPWGLILTDQDTLHTRHPSVLP